MANVVDAAGRKIVEHVDSVPAGEELIAEMRADEAGPARDQTTHSLSPIRRRPCLPAVRRRPTIAIRLPNRGRTLSDPREVPGRIGEPGAAGPSRRGPADMLRRWVYWSPAAGGLSAPISPLALLRSDIRSGSSTTSPPVGAPTCWP